MKRLTKMKLSAAVVVVLFAFQATVAVVHATAPSTLTVGYYNDKCNRSVQGIVRDTVRAALDADSTKGAALIRLLFHDCFVRFIDSVKLNFIIFSATKIILWYILRIYQTTSAWCRAARDASVYLSNGGVNFTVPAGRLDSVNSSAADAAANLLGSTFEVGKLISNFAAKGFTPEEVVILSGAHSVGRAHCSSFRDRLAAPSSEINPYFRDSVLRKYCGAGPADPLLENNIRDQNATALGNLTSYVVPTAGGDLLDNSYYHVSSRAAREKEQRRKLGEEEERQLYSEKNVWLQYLLPLLSPATS
ncbi:hypothetical protein EJB05_30932, partial [Eragrostis curvula]